MNSGSHQPGGHTAMPAPAPNRVLLPVAMAAPAPLPAGAQLAVLDGRSMGTSWQVRLVRPQQISPDALHAGIQQALDLVVAQMSHWQADSALSRFNSAPADSWHTLPAELFKVLDYAMFVAQQSGGAFDPCLGKLVNLWGFGPAPQPPAVPAAEQIRNALQGSGWRRLQLDRAQGRAHQPGGVALDFSGIAKGYAVDQVARYLAAQGIHAYLVEVGGELRGLGCKPDGSPWWTRLEHPDATSSNNTIVALHGLAIATSGDYLRFFEQDGRRYSHTVDGRTGYPIEHALASVTVLHAECMAADAHATAIMVLGTEQGLAYAEQWQLPCLLVSRHQAGFSETMSSAMRAMLN